MIWTPIQWIGYCPTCDCRFIHNLLRVTNPAPDGIPCTICNNGTIYLYNVRKILHDAWRHMKDRCYNPNNNNYSRYGGRRLRVDYDQWLDNFETFFADAISSWRPGLSLERINNNQGYSPTNCRWATKAEQQQNLRTTKLKNGKVLEIRRLYATGNYTQLDLAQIFGVSDAQICRVIKRQNWK